jgi:hypothetical protein
MVKKQSLTIPARTDILSLYEAILPLIYDKLEVDPCNTLLHIVHLKFVSHDFFHFVMNDIAENTEEEGLRMSFETWHGEEEIVFEPQKDYDRNASFDTTVEENYGRMTHQVQKKHPDKPKEYEYYRIISYDDPKIAAGFFRYKGIGKPFTKQEIRILNELAPQLFLILRTVLIEKIHSQKFQYFSSNVAICRGIAKKFRLGKNLTDILPDILFGYSNEEIARRNFISVAAVKKRINHVFKQTATKNRIDFIRKFFTSPERVEL